jgi:hypothetical protein
MCVGAGSVRSHVVGGSGAGELMAAGALGHQRHGNASVSAEATGEAAIATEGSVPIGKVLEDAVDATSRDRETRKRGRGGDT